MNYINKIEKNVTVNGRYKQKRGLWSNFLGWLSLECSNRNPLLVITIYSLENCYHFGPLLTKIVISLSIRENTPIMMDICSFNTPDAYNETRYVYRIICECLKRIYLPGLLCPPHITMWEYIRALRKLYWFTHMDHPIGIWG